MQAGTLRLRCLALRSGKLGSRTRTSMKVFFTLIFHARIPSASLSSSASCRQELEDPEPSLSLVSESIVSAIVLPPQELRGLSFSLSCGNTGSMAVPEVSVTAMIPNCNQTPGGTAGHQCGELPSTPLTSI